MSSAPPSLSVIVPWCDRAEIEQTLARSSALAWLTRTVPPGSRSTGFGAGSGTPCARASV